MKILSQVANMLSGGLLDKVVDKVIPDKLNAEEKAKLSHELTLQMMQNSNSAIMAEAQSSDKYVARARPTFLYIGYIILVFNYILLPLIQMVFGSGTLTPLILPDGFWYLFGTGYLGYSTLRSSDKNGWFASLGKVSR